MASDPSFSVALTLARSRSVTHQQLHSAACDHNKSLSLSHQSKAARQSSRLVARARKNGASNWACGTTSASTVMRPTRSTQRATGPSAQTTTSKHICLKGVLAGHGAYRFCLAWARPCVPLLPRASDGRPAHAMAPAFSREGSLKPPTAVLRTATRHAFGSNRQALLSTTTAALPGANESTSPINKSASRNLPHPRSKLWSSSARAETFSSSWFCSSSWHVLSSFLLPP